MIDLSTLKEKAKFEGLPPITVLALVECIERVRTLCIDSDLDENLGDTTERIQLITKAIDDLGGVE